MSGLYQPICWTKHSVSHHFVFFSLWFLVLFVCAFVTLQWEYGSSSNFHGWHNIKHSLFFSLTENVSDVWVGQAIACQHVITVFFSHWNICGRCDGCNRLIATTAKINSNNKALSHLVLAWIWHGNTEGKNFNYLAYSNSDDFIWAHTHKYET